MSSPPPPAISIDNVQFSWQRSGGYSIAVKEFNVARGEKILLTAPSGAGKSTLISLIAGIVRPQKGSIQVSGTDIAGLPQTQRDQFRAENIGLIFQSLNLIPYLTALENILLPLSFAPRRRDRAGGNLKARATAERLMNEIGLPVEIYGKRKALQLSIGQQQRVAVLRSMIGSPNLIIADEPTSALDTDHQHAFLNMMNDQLVRTGAALIMVSHDLRLSPLFDRTVALSDIAETENHQ